MANVLVNILIIKKKEQIQQIKYKYEYEYAQPLAANK